MPGDRRAMTREAIDLILTAWTAPEPFDWHGEFWQGEKLLIIPQPLTKPHMEVGIACSRSEGTLELTAQKGFIPLMSWAPQPKQLKEMIDIYQRAGAEAGSAAPRGRVRVARMIYVTDSVEQAKRDLGAIDLGAAKVTRRLDQYVPADGTRDDLTMRYMIDQGAFFCGDPVPSILGSKISTTRAAASAYCFYSPARIGARTNSASARCGSLWPRSRRDWQG